MKKEMRKKGISLIVLVITIIVMIILAGTIILTLSQNGIIRKANEAADATNLKQIEQAAMLAWVDAYAGGERAVDKLSEAVTTALTGIDTSKYVITVTAQGVTVSKKDMTAPVASVANGEVTAFTITVNVTATDSETGIKEYRYYIKKDAETDYTLKETLTTGTYTFEELEYTTKYDVKVEVEDNSENITTVYSEDITTEDITVTTLGALVTTAEDYGDRVNYTVTVNAGTTNETTIDDWKVLFKQAVNGEDYIYLITSNAAPMSSIPTNIPRAVINTNGLKWEQNATPTALASGTINTSRWMIGWWGKYGSAKHAIISSYFIDENYWTSFKNSALYGDNVVGAVGAPTAEMFVASWNAKRTLAVANGDTTTYDVELSGIYNANGYWINSGAPALSQDDTLYLGQEEAKFMLATPMGVNDDKNMTYGLWINASADAHHLYFLTLNVERKCRPVVCLKAATPAYAINDKSIGLVRAEQ